MVGVLQANGGAASIRGKWGCAMIKLPLLVALSGATISCSAPPVRETPAVTVSPTQEITSLPEGTRVRVEGFLFRSARRLQLLRGAPRAQPRMVDIGGHVREVRNWCVGIDDADPILRVDDIDFRGSPILPSVASRRRHDLVGQRVVLTGRYEPDRRRVHRGGLHFDTLGTIRRPTLISVTNELCSCFEGAEYCS